MGIFAPHVPVGSYDSFTDLDPTKVRTVLARFLSTRPDGFTVQFGQSGPRVLEFSRETSFEAGIPKGTDYPYEPIIARALTRKDHLLTDFERLLREDSSERELEAYLVTYFREIFGCKYDKIETQIWLRFPEFDIAGKERRLDVFMRNSVSNDWDLFELKRAIPMITPYRDAPAMAAEVTHAIQQLKNYERLLRNPTVRNKLARTGIEYFEPTLNLVIGRTPRIPHEQWRYLLACHSGDVHLVTYDDLLAEMKARCDDRMRLLKELRSGPREHAP